MGLEAPPSPCWLQPWPRNKKADAGRTLDPTHPNTAFMGGWKDEGNAAGDRQLPAAERAIVSQSLSSQADEAALQAGQAQKEAMGGWVLLLLLPLRGGKTH